MKSELVPRHQDPSYRCRASADYTAFILVNGIKKKKEHLKQFELPSVLPINFIATSIFVKCKQEERKAEGAWPPELTVQAAS